MSKSCFITLEGGEGAGKLLHQTLEQKGFAVLYTREPGGTEGAERIRNLLVEGDTAWEPMTELLLHFAARKEHVEKVIKPALKEGKTVICDRFFDSTLAYQAYAHGLGTEIVTMIRHLTIGTFQPDITLFFDMHPEQGMERTKGRAGQEDRYEKLGKAFHARVYEGFKAIAASANGRVIMVSANQTVEEVHKEVIRAVKAFIPLQ